MNAAIEAHDRKTKKRDLTMHLLTTIERCCDQTTNKALNRKERNCENIDPRKSTNEKACE
jgi:hypothetical protein